MIWEILKKLEGCFKPGRTEVENPIRWFKLQSSYEALDLEGSSGHRE
jgi:hypothetical protein